MTDYSSTPSNPAANFDYDVFLSYSSRDGDWVRGELLSQLEAAGLRGCIDVRDFRLGAPTVHEIERAILTSRRTLLVLTPDYLKSQWTEFETLLLQTLDPPNQQLRLIPLLRQTCELPLRIRFLTYLDFRDAAKITLGWQRLLNALTAPLPASGGSTPTTPPADGAHTTPAQPTASPLPPTLPAHQPKPLAPTPEAMRALRAELVKLYSDKPSAVRIAEDVGLPIAMIPLQERAIDTWHAILKEVQTRNRLDVLLQIVEAEFGDSPSLQAAIQKVRQ